MIRIDEDTSSQELDKPKNLNRLVLAGALSCLVAALFLTGVVVGMHLNEYIKSDAFREQVIELISAHGN